jgi:thymidylate synthase ThyX
MSTVTPYDTFDFPHPVLDAGWVMLTDKMGSDEKCVMRARLSHNGIFRGWEKEEPLLAFLMRHEHKSVFQAARMVVRVKMPIETVHEVDRHRTLDLHGDLYGSDVNDREIITTVNVGRKFVNKNEASGRYIDLTTLGVRRIPKSRVGRKGVLNKQGTEGGVAPELVEQFLTEDNALKDMATAHIQKWTDKTGANLAFEIVRGVMPLDNYTIIELDGDALWWMEFFRLRMAPGAKQEVREVATLIYQIFKSLFPRIASLFEEFTLNREVFAGSAARVLRSMLRHLYGVPSEGLGGSGQTFEQFVKSYAEREGLSGGTLAEFVTAVTKND